MALATCAVIVLSFFVAAWWSKAVTPFGTFYLREFQERFTQQTPRGPFTDARLYLRTQIEMRRGADYYTAVDRALAAFDRGQRRLIPTAFAWRQPSLQYLWRALPTVGSLYYAYWALAGLALAASYVVARREAGPFLALLAPLLVSRYYLSGGLSEQWIHSSHAYFGSFFAMYALALWRRPVLAALCGIAAGSLREFFLGLFPAGLVKDRRVWAAAGVVFVGLYILHLVSVRRVSTDSGFDVGSYWLAHGGWDFVRWTFRFGWEEFESQTLLQLLGLVGIAGVLLSRQRLQWASVTLVPLAAYFVIGGPSEQYYANWGIVYMPFLLAAVPVPLARLLHVVPGRESSATASAQ